MEEKSGRQTADSGREVVLDESGWWEMFRQKGVTYDLMPASGSAGRSLAGALEHAGRVVSERPKHIHKIGENARPRADRDEDREQRS